MTIHIETNQLQTKSFEAEVFRAYQKTESTLRKFCTTRSISGISHQFPKYGTLAAVERIVGTPVVAANQSTDKVEISIARFSVATYTDIFLQNEVNFDDKEEAVQAIVSAANRKVDQIIIDALEAQRTGAGYTLSVGVNIGSNNSSLNVAKFAEIARLYDVNNINRNERNLLVHANAYHKFTQETNVASSDYNNYQVLTSGKIPAYYGITINSMGNIENENGMKVASNIRYNYAVQKAALGFVENKALKTEVNYVPTMAADLVACFFSCGSKVIEEKGIIPVQTYEA
jgi:hypothetical protein